MDDQSIQYYEFDCYRLDLYNRNLLRSGELVPLAPKLFDTLSILVKNSDRALSKDDLMNALWTDTIVEESNLAQNIFQLRKILDDRKGAKYIETVSKYGYRFIAPVKLISENKPPLTVISTDDFIIEKSNSVPVNSMPNATNLNLADRKINNRRYYLSFISLTLFLSVFSWWLISEGRSESVAIPLKHSIAILPFKGIVNETSDEQLQLGMTDALINKLSNLRQLSVRPTAAILKYRQNELDMTQASRELNVETILYGTIQKADNRVRVSVQLIRAGDGASLWAENFDTAEKDLFAVQDAISERVSQSLVKHLTTDDKKLLTKAFTSNQEAFEAYSKGIYFLNKRNLEPAIKYFQQAIEKDPAFALAHNGLLDSYMLMIPVNIGNQSAQEFRQLAKTTARKTIDLDSSLAEPHTFLGLITFEESGDWMAAEQE